MRDPLPELYRDVRDAYKTLYISKIYREGKGLRYKPSLLDYTYLNART